MKSLSLISALALLLNITSAFAQSTLSFGNINSIKGDTVDVELIFDNVSGLTLAGWQFDISVKLDPVNGCYGGITGFYNWAIFSWNALANDSSRALAASFGQPYIPPVSTVLTNVVFTNPNNNSEACLFDIIMGPPTGSAITTIPGPCLDLSFCSETTSIVDTTVCGSYVSVSGQTFNVSGTYQDTITNVSGCDSAITINLFINSVASSISNVTVCDNYLWNGVNYSSSGTYIYNTTNGLGCDSIATLVLNINNSSNSSDFVFLEFVFNA